MVDSTGKALSIAEAKDKLRQAAGPLAYVKSHPYRCLTLALFAGFLFANNQGTLRLLINRLIRGSDLLTTIERILEREMAP